MPINEPISRRELTKRMLSASLGGLAAMKLRAAVPVWTGASTGVRFEPVRRRIQQAVAQHEATGVSVAVVHEGRIVWEEGFGWANREAGLKATSRTPFSLASVTKPFTATTIMTLVAEGRLSLDDSANKYLAGCRLAGAAGDAVKVRLLGAHASGLPGIFESYDADEARMVPSTKALLQDYGRLAYPPSVCYEYSNLGFAALHAIAANITQTDLGALMHRRVLSPLGLDDSFFGSDPVKVQSGALRYDAFGRIIPHYTTSTPASGELYASAHDLALFALFNMRLEDKGHRSIMSGQHLEQLHRPIFSGPSGVSTTFGWFKGQTASGIPFLFKGGGDPGVANQMYFIPAKKLACIVVTNRSNGRELAESVCDEVISGYLEDWRRPQEDSGSPDMPFVATIAWKGQWHGWLEGGGAKMPTELRIDSHEVASLAIGSGPHEKITAMQSEGEAFIGESTGRIDAPDATRTGAKTLQIKLLLHDEQLFGRVFAVAGDPDVKNVRLPYILRLSRT